MARLTKSERDAYRFGEWVVEPGLNRLSKDAYRRQLEPLAMDVLTYLLTHHDRVVAADEILDQVWPDRFADPGMVKKRVAQIRRALGDDARDPSYIETISKRGYRAIASVSPLDPAPERPIPHDQTLNELSLAIGPFTCGADAPGAASYAGGLIEELSGLFAQYPELRLSTSRQPHPDVSYTLSIDLRGFDERLRIRLNLSRNADQRLVWSRAFEDSTEHMFVQQTQLASTVARVIRLELVKDAQCELVRRKSRNEEATRLIRAAQSDFYAVQQGGDYDPVLHLNSARRAVALDPDLPEGHFFLAMSLNLLHAFGAATVADVSEEAYDAIERGLQLDPDNPLLIWALGEAQSQFDLNYPAAENSFRRAIETSPMHLNSRLFHESLAMLMLRRARLGEALDHYRRAMRVYDADAHVYEGFAYALLIDSQFREALRVAGEGKTLVPAGGWRDSLTSISVRSHVALNEALLAEAMLSNELSGVDLAERPMLIPAVAAAGRGEEAARALAKLEELRNPFAYVMAIGYAMVGDASRCFEWVHRGITHRLPSTMMFLRLEPGFEVVRQDPRWDGVLRHLRQEELHGEATSRYGSDPSVPGNVD